MGRGRLHGWIFAATCLWIVWLGSSFTALFSAVPAEASPYPARNVTIGVVRDGASADLDAFIDEVENHLEASTGTEYVVHFKHSASFNGGWSKSGARRALQAALNDASVQYIFAAGVLTTQAAARKDLPFRKPVVAAAFFDAEVPGLSAHPFNRSGKPNFNFVIIPGRLRRDLETFHRMVPFKTVRMLVDSAVVSDTSRFDGKLTDLGRKLGFRIRLVPVGNAADPVLQKLPANTEAVYLTPAFHMSRKEQRKLVDGLTAKKVPSFSFLGYTDVEQGVLAALSPIQTKPLARRIAIHLRQLLDGMPADQLPVTMSIEEQLVINARTAALIGYHPSVDVKLQAEFIDEHALDRGENLSLAKSMEIAVANNPDLAIQKDQVDIARQDVNRAKSYMLPQVGGNTQYLQVDPDSAEASYGAQPEYQTTIGLKAQQMIYDDQIVSNYRASSRLYQGTEFDAESVQLNVMEQAALRYLDYLAARALAQIEDENLKLTRSNLDLARVRAQVGVGEPEEVFRWESNYSSQKAALLKARSRTEQARVALNRALGVDQRMRWETAEIKVTDNQLYFHDPRMRPLLQNSAQLEAFRKFAVDLAFANQPSLKSLERSIEAQQIVLGQMQRRFVLPSFNTSFEIDHRLDSKTLTPSSGLSSDSIPSLSGPGSETDDDQWSWSVTVSLPLFEGGRRFYDVARAKAEIQQLKDTRVQQKHLIEQSVQGALYALDGSQPGIRLSRSSEESALKNLKVVRDQYARGTVPIITLLDAQNRAFTASQQSVIAVYTYLQDLMKFQRAIAWFESTKSEQERQELADRFRAYLRR